MNKQEKIAWIVEKIKHVYPTRESVLLATYALDDLHSLNIPTSKDKLSEVVERLLRKEPLGYITGIQHFYGNVYRVNHHVLIPRPETEELVHWIIERFPASTSVSMLEIGVGSGCISITLAKQFPNAAIHGIDISSDAVSMAKQNATVHEANCSWSVIDFLDERNWPLLGKPDLIVCNPPYIDPEDQAKVDESVLNFEPRDALFAKGQDPLIFYRHIARFAIQQQAGKSGIFVELNEYHHHQIADIFRPEFAVEVREDMQSNPRMLLAIPHKPIAK